MRKRLQLLIILLIIQTLPALAQNIQGRVSDNMGESVAGAGVVNTGSGAYSITDAEGFYSLKASEGDVLEISFVGLKTRRITVGKESRLDIVMQIDEETLDEAFVVAYGTSRKSSFTGSAEVVSADDIAERPVSHVTKSIDGKVAGVMATSGSGQPGSGAGIMIRGYGSINAASSPLLVVDGMPFDGDLNAISPSDIESLTILKDASAGALYGARGANGVIMITTRSAKAQEKVRVDFSTKLSVMSRAIPKYNTVDAREYMELMYNAIYNDL
ncbi:MAG: TonB-dependent receptor plug domain-containing protein, partial [Bacteroidales bacterium]|nr:TonB-dependent receptor plug domain-containing protein [Bacteroidales bacterium]